MCLIRLTIYSILNLKSDDVEELLGTATYQIIRKLKATVIDDVYIARFDAV